MGSIINLVNRLEPMDIIFETIHLSKAFGALLAVDDVSLKVRRNSLHAIIGPNGAGKTTFFNLITGMFPSTSQFQSSEGIVPNVPRAAVSELYSAQPR